MNIIKADLYRIVHSISFWVMLGAMAVCALAFTLCSHNVETGAMGMEAVGTASILMDTMIITVIGPVFAATYFGVDFQSKSIHDNILYGGKRFNIVLYKTILFVLGIGALALPYGLCTIIGVTTGSEFSDVFAKAVDSSYMTVMAGYSDMDAGLYVKLIVVVLSIGLMHAARLSLCVPLSFLLKKQVPIIASGILLELLISLSGVLFMNNEVMSDIIGWTPFTLMNKINLTTGYGDICKNVFTSILFIAIMLVISSLIFKKSEVK